jgi:hypothetical protein
LPSRSANPLSATQAAGRNLAAGVACAILDAGCAEAVAGCDYVLHVASPYPSKAAPWVTRLSMDNREHVRGKQIFGQAFNRAELQFGILTVREATRTKGMSLIGRSLNASYNENDAVLDPTWRHLVLLFLILVDPGAGFIGPRRTVRKAELRTH